MIYSQKLKQIREESNLTQEQISNVIKIERGVYSLYETEYKLMPIKHLNTLANFYDTSLDYLFSFNKKKNYPNSKTNINLELQKIRLKEIRKENNITQTKLAKKLNIANGTIAEYERGTNIIATPFLYTICKTYNISADYLLGKIDEPKYLN